MGAAARGESTIAQAPRDPEAYRRDVEGEGGKPKVVPNGLLLDAARFRQELGIPIEDDQDGRGGAENHERLAHERAMEEHLRPRLRRLAAFHRRRRHRVAIARGDEEPKRKPRQPHRGGDDERCAKAVCVRDLGRERRRDHCPERAPGEEQAHRGGPFALRERRSDRTRGRRERRRLEGAEQRAEHEERHEPLREGVRCGRERPEDDRYRERALRADAVHDSPGDGRKYQIGDRESRAEPPEAGVRNAQLLPHRRRDRGQCLPVEVTYRHGQCGDDGDEERRELLHAHPPSRNEAASSTTMRRAVPSIACTTRGLTKNS